MLADSFELRWRQTKTSFVNAGSEEQGRVRRCQTSIGDEGKSKTVAASQIQIQIQIGDVSQGLVPLKGII